MSEIALQQAFVSSIKLLVELASLQTAFLTLDEAIKTTNRRVNALDNVVRPKLENTIAYIKVKCTLFLGINPLDSASTKRLVMTYQTLLSTGMTFYKGIFYLEAGQMLSASFDPFSILTWFAIILVLKNSKPDTETFTVLASLKLEFLTFSLQGELDELEREEFFRLKKVQNKKQRDVPVSFFAQICTLNMSITYHYTTLKTLLSIRCCQCHIFTDERALGATGYGKLEYIGHDMACDCFRKLSSIIHEEI